MSSFYGGVDGRPFIIKKFFLTVSEMITEFKKGHSYKEVNYGEYVIINTVNKNNPENGRIFRRTADLGTTQIIETWDLTESKNIFERTPKQFNGAVYMGQIVGPSGNAPHFISLPTHLPQLDGEGKYKYDDNNNLLYEEELSDYEEVLQRYTAYDTRSGEGVFSIENTHLVPGKEGEVFNDNITWQYCSVRDENEQETNAYIGFTFPYMIVEWDASSVNPYYNRDKDNTSEFKNLNLVDREDDTLHPFYQKWKINVPKGIHGQSIENLRIVDEGTEEEPKKVLKYDLRNYDTQQEGEVSTYLVGDYNMINSIKLSDTGFLDIDTTASQNEIHQQLHWIKNIQIDDTTGKITYTEVDGKTATTQQLTWVDDIKFDPNGTITIIDVDGSERTGPLNAEGDAANAYKNLIKWITGMSLNPDNGAFKVDFNHDFNNENPAFEQKLTWIKNIEMQVGTPDNPGDGTIKIYYTHRNGADNDTETHSKALNWITELSFDSETGHFILKTNNDNINDIDKSLTWIKEFTLSDTGVLNFKTTTGEHDINNRQLHWVKDISTNGNTGVVTYTDIDGTSTTEQLNWVKKVEFDENGTVTVKYTDPAKEDDIYENLIDWIKEINISQDGTVSVESNNGTQLLSSEQKLKWIESVELQEDGTFLRHFNNGDPTEQDSKLIWPVNIHINSANGEVITTYNNGEENNSQNPKMDWITSATLNEHKQLQIDYVNAEDISVDLKTPNKIELTEGGDFYATYNTGERALLGKIGELNPISATAIGEGEEEPANLMTGGILFITQEATMEE